MPATATTSWKTPAFCSSGATSAAFLTACPLDPLCAPFVSSQAAVFLLKNSDEASRFTAGCFERAILFVDL